jgi:glycerophosphoryl diester phosphodiesterase
VELPPPPWVIAHRGASGDRLENTVESCRLAVELGAPMIEVDVQLARDGTLVVIHDWDLRRLGGSRRVVERLTAAEIVAAELALPARSFAAVAVGVEPPPPLRGVAPTLQQLFAVLPSAFPLNLELKRRRANRARFAAALAAEVGSRPNLVVSSFDHELLARVAEAAPGLALAPLDDEDPRRLEAAGDRLGAWALHAHRRLASPELVHAAAAAKRHLLVYTVNSPDVARELFAMGVAGVFSDWPAEVLASLGTADGGIGGSPPSRAGRS